MAATFVYEIDSVRREVALCGTCWTTGLLQRVGVRVVDVDWSTPDTECVGCKRKRDAAAAADRALTVRLAQAGVVAYGFKAFGESRMDGGLHWFAFDEPLAEDDATRAIWGSDAADCWGYGGPGRPFADRPNVRTGANRTLVTQRVGWDV